MSAAPSYLALDLGASSGRAVVGTLEQARDGAAMTLHEVHRFRTPLVEEDGHLCWDVGALWDEIVHGIVAALAVAPELRSISIDSWAVDYQPLDAQGRPVRRPYAYRDPRTYERMADALRRAGGRDAVYACTGIQCLPFNTLTQVAVDLDDEPALVRRTATRVLLADYFLARLSGVRVAERTMASTTQLMDATTGDWSAALIGALGDDLARWPRIVPPGTVLGPARLDSLGSFASLGAAAPQIVATCSHDTAAAVAAVPASDDEAWAYISSGTWSLVGAELDAPILTSAACDAGFTNEAGLDGTVRFLKNRTGMWVLEECMREWSAAGAPVAYGVLASEAADAGPSSHVVDLNAPRFLERGDMIAAIHAACAADGIAAPATRGALVRLVLDSLADSYARTLRELDALTGRHTAVVHVVGGGAQNALLNQLTADAVGRRVVAGPAEATVLGNLLVQARALGDLPSGVTVRDVARRSARLVEYLPGGRAPMPALAAARG